MRGQWIVTMWQCRVRGGGDGATWAEGDSKAEMVVAHCDVVI